MKNKLSNPQHEADFIARYGQIPTDQWPTSRDGMEWKLKREGYLAGREDGEKELASMSATEACAAIPAMFEWAEGKEKELSIASAATEQMEAGLYEASEEFKDQLAEKDAIIAQLREALELRKVWTSREIHQAHVVPRIEEVLALPADIPKDTSDAKE